MVVAVLPSWQYIYCRYSTFVFFLFSTSFPTTAFLWSHQTFTGATQLQGPALAEQGVTAVHMGPRSAVGAVSRETHQIELHTAGKTVPMKTQGRGPWTAFIQKPVENTPESNLASRALGFISSLDLSGPAKRKHGCQYSDPVLILYHHSCCLPL